jgi:hypothetical protein
VTSSPPAAAVWLARSSTMSTARATKTDHSYLCAPEDKGTRSEREQAGRHLSCGRLGSCRAAKKPKKTNPTTDTHNTQTNMCAHLNSQFYIVFDGRLRFHQDRLGTSSDLAVEKRNSCVSHLLQVEENTARVRAPQRTCFQCIICYTLYVPGT